jgi:hypothetical protein
MGDKNNLRYHLLQADGFVACAKRNPTRTTKDPEKVTCGYCRRKLMPEATRKKQPNRYTMAKEAR